MDLARELWNTIFVGVGSRGPIEERREDTLTLLEQHIGNNMVKVCAYLVFCVCLFVSLLSFPGLLLG